MIADLARDSRDTIDVGRRARLELVFGWRAGRTVLAHAYAEPPFRVGHVFPEGDGLHMIMASSAPGIFSGDRFEQTIRVEAGARVRLTSQSALQAHGAGGGPESGDAGGVRPQPDHSECVSACHVADGATLHCQWDPLIPFVGANFRQRIDIHVSGTAWLYWSDAFMAGRVGSGERWAFSSLAHELRVTRGSRLEYLERYQIDPGTGGVTNPWVAGECCYFGTALALGHALTPATVDELHRELADLEGVGSAIDALDRDLVVARLMATSGPPFHDARARLCAVLVAKVTAP